MNRKELIESDEWITAFLECVVISGKSVKLMRKEISEQWIKHRIELLSTPPPVEAYVRFKKVDWDNFKERMGNRSYQGLINIEDFANIIGELEDKNI